ncbi:MAG: trypsin-like peptidase domain-containing protein, partial [Candidatus Kerfeldbacteria bacterium]|nr:trypsin-like peptidase domain-containing protein [Candidatus Kerfeldbacteria bacterium]
MTPENTNPPRGLNPLSAAAIISILVGGFAGGLAGYTVTTHPSLTNTGGTSTTITKGTVSVTENSATIDVFNKASPAVVSIIISKDFSKIYQAPVSPFDNFFGFPSQQQPTGQQEVGQGSGFVVGSDGLIVTNKHVVDDDQAQYTVIMNDGKKYDAKVLAKDPTNDVALVKIEATNLPTVSLGDSSAVQIGQSVIAIGNALGQYRNTVTKGIVSGKSRTIQAGDGSGQSETLEDVFQTDAAINRGNSGGPLLNLAGQAIGVNTAVDSNGQLIGFAIPINVIKRDIDSQTKNGKIIRPYLGVRYVLITQALADQ